MEYIKLFEEYVGNTDIFLDHSKENELFASEERYIEELKKYLYIHGDEAVTQYVLNFIGVNCYGEALKLVLKYTDDIFDGIKGDSFMNGIVIGGCKNMFDFAMENDCDYKDYTMIIAFENKNYEMFDELFTKKINFKNIKEFMVTIPITNRKLEKYIKEKYPHLVAALDHGLI